VERRLDEVRFAAPWSTSVKWVTGLALVILPGASAIVLLALPAAAPFFARLTAAIVPLAILLGVLPFMVRGYVLRGQELIIERLGWCNRFNLAGLISATADPEATRGSIRLGGSGGLFGFFGLFRNRQLGSYWAYGTDPSRTVVVRLADRTIVVTPDDPARFTAALGSRR